MNTRERLFDRIKMLPAQSVAEEIASGIIHGIGILTAIASLVILVVFASLDSNVNQVVAFSIYGGFAVFYFLCSTFHHSLTHYKAKRVFRIMEQSAVYLYLTGAAMPVALTMQKPNWSYIFFGVTVLLALISIINLFFNKKSSSDVNFGVDIILFIFIAISLGFSLHYFNPQFKVFFIPGSSLFLFAFILASMNGLKYNQAYSHAFSLAGNVLLFFAFFSQINI